MFGYRGIVAEKRFIFTRQTRVSTKSFRLMFIATAKEVVDTSAG
jgi:hypothetical protein